MAKHREKIVGGIILVVITMLFLVDSLDEVMRARDRERFAVHPIQDSDQDAVGDRTSYVTSSYRQSDTSMSKPASKITQDDEYGVRADDTNAIAVVTPTTSVERWALTGAAARGTSAQPEGRARGLNPSALSNQRIAFVSSAGKNGEDSHIFIINANGRNRHRLDAAFDSESDCHWSPDGQWIAFSAKAQGPSQIFISDANGQNVYQITEEEREARHPAWSPDGLQIAYQAEAENNSEIHIVGVEGQHEHTLTVDAVIPAWSPDGGHVAFVRSNDSKFDLHVIDATGENDRVLDSNVLWSADRVGGAWSPDGSHIIYSKELQIVSIASDGTGRRILSPQNLEPGMHV